MNIATLIAAVHHQSIAAQFCCSGFIAARVINRGAEMKCLSMIIGIITMRCIICKTALWCSGRVIGRNKNSSPEFSMLKLHGMPRSIGIASPVLRKIVSNIYLWLFWALHLQCYVYCFAPSLAIFGLNYITHITQTNSTSYFAFIFIAGIIK